MQIIAFAAGQKLVVESITAIASSDALPIASPAALPAAPAPAQADLGEVIGVIIFIVVALAKLISGILEQSRQAQAPPPRQPAAPARGQASETAADEVRKFLEQAAQRKKASATNRPAPQPLDRQSLDPPGSPVTGTQFGGLRERSPEPAVVDAELVDVPRRDARATDSRGGPSARPNAGARRGNSVSEHVTRHLGGEHFPHATPSVDQADEQLEAHLHQVFDHRLGEISEVQPQVIEEGTDGASWQTSYQTDRSAPRESTAASLARLLRQPQQLRQAVILAEILRRPDDRI